MLQAIFAYVVVTGIIILLYPLANWLHSYVGKRWNSESNMPEFSLAFLSLVLVLILRIVFPDKFSLFNMQNVVEWQTAILAITAAIPAGILAFIGYPQ